VRRRRLLGLAAVGAAGTVAGCLGGDGDSGGDDGSDDHGSDSDEIDAVSGDNKSDNEWPAGPYADYATTTVTVETPGGEERGAVTAAVADDSDTRPRGLSDAASLPADGGMLFVFSSARESLTFIMPEMSFGIDIVFISADREIVEIHNAPEPGPDEDGSEQEYEGSGRYVLEVPYEWTDRHGVEVGDSVAFEL